MSDLPEPHAEMGREFDERLGRSDGACLARSLHERLEQDLKDWFYDRVFRLFDGVPNTEWSEQDQMTSEFRCRNEVSCFQSIEVARFAEQCGYVAGSDTEWFVDWTLKLNLGQKVFEQSKEMRLHHYWGKSDSDHREAFALHLADALPKLDWSIFVIHYYVPLLPLATKATTANSFGDYATAKSTQSEHDKLDSQVAGAIDKYFSGGGNCFVIESQQGLFVPFSEEHGRIFNVWFEAEAAQQHCEELEPGHRVSPMNFRELESQLMRFQEVDCNVVTVDLGTEQGGKLLPIGTLIEKVQDQIRSVDESEMGKLFGQFMK